MKRLLLSAACTAFLTSPDPALSAPWNDPRDFAAFQFLVERSPFSLPTAEESSPLAERFSLAGSVSIDGNQMVLISDKNTQQRHMIGKSPHESGISLIEFFPDPDPKRMRASIRVGTESATISYAESQPQPATAQAPTAVVNPPGAPQPNPAVANAQVNPGQPAQTGQPPVRRVIRRRTISGDTQPAKK